MESPMTQNYSTVTLFAKLRGLSTSQPSSFAKWLLEENFKGAQKSLKAFRFYADESHQGENLQY
jgi:hypothetical protein